MKIKVNTKDGLSTVIEASSVSVNNGVLEFYTRTKQAYTAVAAFASGEWVSYYQMQDTQSE